MELEDTTANTPSIHTQYILHIPFFQRITGYGMVEVRGSSGPSAPAEPGPAPWAAPRRISHSLWAAFARTPAPHNTAVLPDRQRELLCSGLCLVPGPEELLKGAWLPSLCTLPSGIDGH